MKLCGSLNAGGLCKAKVLAALKHGGQEALAQGVVGLVFREIQF